MAVKGVSQPQTTGTLVPGFVRSAGVHDELGRPRHPTGKAIEKLELIPMQTSLGLRKKEMCAERETINIEKKKAVRPEPFEIEK